MTNGEAALRATALLPDLILLDINMPGLSGYEVCRRLKENPRTQDIPVLFISALSEVEEKVHAFRAGGLDYITKPFQVDEVLARVKIHLNLRRAMKEVRESYAKLKELEQQRDTMVHMIVHDMRSPLLSLTLSLELLSDSVPAHDVNATRMMRAGRACVQSVVEMANQMLLVSKLESGALPVARRSVDLGSLAGETVESHRHVAGSRQLACQIESGVSAEVDRDLIRRAMDNLLSNAIKHTSASGRIEIQVNRDRGRATFRVRDTGPGISPAAQEKLFTKFGQLAADDARRGFGLGLAFVRLAIEAHGGEIGVESTPGAGSTFWFGVPMSPRG